MKIEDKVDNVYLIFVILGIIWAIVSIVSGIRSGPAEYQEKGYWNDDYGQDERCSGPYCW